MARETTGDPRFDTWIQTCSSSIAPDDALRLNKDLADKWKTFRRKETSETFISFLDCFRELIVGGFLAAKGRSVRYSHRFENPAKPGKFLTPDWTMLSADAQVIAIIEVDNFHGDRAYDQWDRGTSSVPSPSPSAEAESKRLYDSLENKCLKYRDLATHLGTPFVIASVLTWAPLNCLDPSHVTDQCTSSNGGLFRRFPEVSGLLHCGETNGYRMWYEPNDLANAKIQMPTGWFSN
jgi:hypothetical protein